jgi:hypothetical protein
VVRWETDSGGLTWRIALDGPNAERPPYADLTTLKGANLAAAGGLPAGSASLRAAPDGTLWVHSADGQCQGVKGTEGFACSMTYSLWESKDAGMTWKVIPAP